MFVGTLNELVLAPDEVKNTKEGTNPFDCRACSSYKTKNVRTNFENNTIVPRGHPYMHQKTICA